MRNLEHVINQILSVTTIDWLKNRLEKIKYDIGFTAPELMGMRWNLVHEALCDSYPNPIENDESIEVFCIFTTMSRDELIKAINE